MWTVLITTRKNFKNVLKSSRDPILFLLHRACWINVLIQLGYRLGLTDEYWMATEWLKFTISLMSSAKFKKNIIFKCYWNSKYSLSLNPMIHIQIIKNTSKFRLITMLCLTSDTLVTHTVTPFDRIWELGFQLFLLSFESLACYQHSQVKFQITLYNKLLGNCTRCWDNDYY